MGNVNLKDVAELSENREVNIATLNIGDNKTISLTVNTKNAENSLQQIKCVSSNFSFSSGLKRNSPDSTQPDPILTDLIGNDLFNPNFFFNSQFDILAAAENIHLNEDLPTDLPAIADANYDSDAEDSECDMHRAGYFVMDKLIGSRFNNKTQKHEFLFKPKLYTPKNEIVWNPISNCENFDVSLLEHSRLYIEAPISLESMKENRKRRTSIRQDKLLSEANISSEKYVSFVPPDDECVCPENDDTRLDMEMTSVTKNFEDMVPVSTECAPGKCETLNFSRRDNIMKKKHGRPRASTKNERRPKISSKSNPHYSHADRKTSLSNQNALPNCAQTTQEKGEQIKDESIANSGLVKEEMLDPGASPSGTTGVVGMEMTSSVTRNFEDMVPVSTECAPGKRETLNFSLRDNIIKKKRERPRNFTKNEGRPKISSKSNPHYSRANRKTSLSNQNALPNWTQKTQEKGEQIKVESATNCELVNEEKSDPSACPASTDFLNLPKPDNIVNVPKPATTDDMTSAYMSNERIEVSIKINAITEDCCQDSTNTSLCREVLEENVQNVAIMDDQGQLNSEVQCDECCNTENTPELLEANVEAREPSPKPIANCSAVNRKRKRSENKSYLVEKIKIPNRSLENFEDYSKNDTDTDEEINDCSAYEVDPNYSTSQFPRICFKGSRPLKRKNKATVSDVIRNKIKIGNKCGKYPLVLLRRL